MLFLHLMKGILMLIYSQMKDEQLVKLCRENDAAAWKELYVRYAAVSKSLSLKLGGKNSETDDLTQEGMIGFLSAVHSYKSDKEVSFKTYAYACIRNRIVNAVKSRASQKCIPPESCRPLEEQTNVADAALTPDELLISRNCAEAIMQIVLSKLTDTEQKVFRLYLGGKTYEEIASALSMSRKGVDGALQRARKKLKSELAAY